MAGFAPCGRGSLAPRRGPCIGLAIREFGFPRGSLVLLSGGHLMRASSQRWPPLNKTPSLLRGRLPDSQVFAESEGFEPPEAFTSTVFKTAALNHSANSPTYFTFLSERIAKVVKKIYSEKFFLAFRLFFAFSTF